MQNKKSPILILATVSIAVPFVLLAYATKGGEAKGNSVTNKTSIAGSASTNSPGTSQQTAPQTSGDTKADNPKKQTKAPRHTLTGAELYSMHCNRCHPERYPTERTAAQWKTILLHMRVRANLPADHARTILKYLQDNSGR